MKSIIHLFLVSYGLLLGQVNIPVQTWIHTSGDQAILNSNNGFNMPIYMETTHVVQDAGNPNVYHTSVFNTNGSMMYQRTDVTDNGIYHRSFQYFGNDLRPVHISIPNTDKEGDNDEKDIFHFPDQ